MINVIFSRYNLRKDLEQRMNSESMIQLGNLAQSIRENEDDDEEAGQQGAGPTSTDGDGTSGPASDLFSEIHLNELQKLEKKLEGSEFEKMQLDSALKESKDTLDKLTVCLASQVMQKEI